jgi:hypothetical protein
MFKRLFRWAKKAIVETRDDIIRSFIIRHIIKFLTGTAGMSIIFTIYGIIKNNSFMLISIIIAALNILIVWAVFHKKNKLEPIQKTTGLSESTQISAESGFISLREVVLVLEKNERISQNKALLDMMKGRNMTRDQYLIQYNVQEYLKGHLYGNEVILREISPQKIKIPSPEYPSQKENSSIVFSDNKWGKDCNSLCSAEEEVLYTNVSVERNVFENILEKQSHKLFEMEHEI